MAAAMMKSAGVKVDNREDDDNLTLDASILRIHESNIRGLKKTITPKSNSATENLELTIYETDEIAGPTRKAYVMRHAKFRLTTDFPLPPPKPNTASILLNAVAVRQSAEYHRKLEAEIDKINVNFYKNFLKRKQYERVIAKFTARAKNLIFLAGGAAVVYGTVNIAGPYVIQYLLQHNLLAPGSRFVTMFKASLELFFNIHPQKMKALDSALKTMQEATKNALGTVGHMGIGEGDLFTKAFGILPDGKNNPFTERPISEDVLTAATKFSSGGKTYVNASLAKYQEAVIGLFNTVLDVISPSPLITHFLEQTGLNSKIRPSAAKIEGPAAAKNPWIDFSTFERSGKVLAIKTILKVDDTQAEDILARFEFWSNQRERLEAANALYKNYSMDFTNIYGLIFDDAYANPKFQMNYVNKLANRLSQNRTFRAAFSNGFSSWVGKPSDAPTRADGLMKPVLLFYDSITPQNFMGYMGGMVYDELTQSLSTGLQTLSSSVFSPSKADMADDDDDERAKKAQAMEEYREIIKKTTVLRLREGRGMESVANEIKVLSKVMHPDYKFDGNDVALLDHIWYSFGMKTNDLFKSGRIKAALTWTGLTTITALVGEITRYDKGNPFNNTQSSFKDVFSFYSEPFYEVTRDFMTTWTSGHIRGILQDYRDLFTKLYDETYDAYIRKPLLAMAFMKDIAKWQKNAKAWIAFKNRWFISVYINMCLEKIIDFTFGILTRTITEMPYQGVTQIDFMLGPDQYTSWSMSKFPMMLTNEYVSWIFEGITRQNIYGLYGHIAKAYNERLNSDEMRTLSAGIDIAQSAIQQGGDNIHAGLITSLQREARSAEEAFPGFDEAALYRWVVNIMSKPTVTSPGGEPLDEDIDTWPEPDTETPPEPDTEAPPEPDTEAPPVRSWHDWVEAQLKIERQRISNAYKAVAGAPAAAAAALRAARKAAWKTAEREITERLLKSQRELVYSMIPHGKRYTQDTYWFHLPNGGKIKLNPKDTLTFKSIFDNSNFMNYVAEQFILSGEKKPCNAEFLNTVAPGLARDIANTESAVSDMCSEIDAIYTALSTEKARLATVEPPVADANAAFRLFLRERRQAALRDLMRPYFQSYQIGANAYENTFLDPSLQGIFQSGESYVEIGKTIWRVSKSGDVPATGILASAGYNFVPLSSEEVARLHPGTIFYRGFKTEGDFANIFYSGIYGRNYISPNVVPAAGQWVESMNANFVFANPKFFFYNSLSSAADLYYQRYVISGMMTLGLSASADDDSDDNKARRTYLEKVKESAKRNPLIAKNLYELTVIWESISRARASLDATLAGLTPEEARLIDEQRQRFNNKDNPTVILDDRIYKDVKRLENLEDERDALINNIFHNLPDSGTFTNLRTGNLNALQARFKEESRKAALLLDGLPDDDNIGTAMNPAILEGLFDKVDALPDKHPNKADYNAMLIVFARGPINLVTLQKLRDDLTEFIARADRIDARIDAHKTTYGDTTAFYDEIRELEVHGTDLASRASALSAHHAAWDAINGSDSTISVPGQPNTNVNVVTIETTWATYVREDASRIFTHDNSSIQTNIATLTARFDALPGNGGAAFMARRSADFTRLMSLYSNYKNDVINLPDPTSPNYNNLLQGRYNEIIARTGTIDNARIALELFLLRESGGQAAYASFIDSMLFKPAGLGETRNLKPEQTPAELQGMQRTQAHINRRLKALSGRMDSILALSKAGLTLNRRQKEILKYYSTASGKGDLIIPGRSDADIPLTDEQRATLAEYGQGMDQLLIVDAHTVSAQSLYYRRRLYMLAADAIAERTRAIEYGHSRGRPDENAYNELVTLYTGKAPEGSGIKFVYRKVSGPTETDPQRLELIRLTAENPFNKSTDTPIGAFDSTLQGDINLHSGARDTFAKSMLESYRTGRLRTFDEKTAALKHDFSDIIATVRAESEHIQVLIDNFALTGGSPNTEYLKDLQSRQGILQNIMRAYKDIVEGHEGHRSKIQTAVLKWTTGQINIPNDPTFRILMARLRGLFDITDPTVKTALQASLSATVIALGEGAPDTVASIVETYLLANGTGCWDVLLSNYSGDESKLAIIRAAKTAWFAGHPLRSVPVLHNGGQKLLDAVENSAQAIYTAVVAERVAAELDISHLRGFITRIKLASPGDDGGDDDDDDGNDDLGKLRLYFSLHPNVEAAGHLRTIDDIITGILRAPTIPDLVGPQTSREAFKGIITELAHLRHLNAFLKGTSVDTVAMAWQTAQLTTINDGIRELRKLQTQLETPVAVVNSIGTITGTGVPGGAPESLNPSVLLKKWSTFLKDHKVVPSESMQARYVALEGDLTKLESEHSALLKAMASRTGSPEDIETFERHLREFQTKFNALSNVPNLRTSGETATSLKITGFSAIALYVKDGYTVDELIDAGYDAKSLLAAGVSALQIKTANAATRPGRKTISLTDMIDAGFTLTNLQKAYTALEVKTADTRAPEKQFTVAQMKTAGYSAGDLKLANFTARDLYIKDGYTVEQLIDAGYDATALKTAEIKAKDIVEANAAVNPSTRPAQKKIALNEMIDAGYDAVALRAAGITASEIKAANAAARTGKKTITLNEMIDAGYDAAALFTARITAKDIIEANAAVNPATRPAQKTIALSEMIDAGYDAAALRAAGITAAEITAANAVGNAVGNPPTRPGKKTITLSALIDAGYDAAALRAAGITAKELVDVKGANGASKFTIGMLSTRDGGAGYSAKELKAAGFGVVALKGENYLISAISEAGFTIDELLVVGGFTDTEVAAIKTVAILQGEGWTALRLQKAGFTASALKGTGAVPHFTAAQLVNAAGQQLFTATQLKEAGYDAGALKAARFTARELIEANNNDKRPGVDPYSPNILYAAGYDVKDIREAWPIPLTLDKWAATGALAVHGRGTNKYIVPVEEFIAGGYTIDHVRLGGFSIRDLNVGRALQGFPAYSAKDLRDGGYSALLLFYEHGYTNLRILKDGGYTAKELKNGLPANVATAAELKAATFTATELKEAPFTAAELNAAKFTATELKAAKFTATDLKAVPFTATELKAAGFNATQLKEADFSAAELKAAPFSAAQLKTANFTAADLKAGGFTGARGLKAGGFSAAELKAVDFTAAQLKAVGFTAAQLKAAPFTAAELKAAPFTATQLNAVGFTLVQLKEGGFTATELKAEGFTAIQLKAAKFTATELKAALFTATELKAAGFTATELKAALFTVTELKNAGFSASDLKTAGFTAADLKAGGFTDAKELKQGGFSASDLHALGFSLAELFRAGYTAKDLRAVPFTAAQLIVYFEPPVLKDAGFSDVEIAAADVGKGDAKRAASLADAKASLKIITNQNIGKYGNDATTARTASEVARNAYDAEYTRLGGAAIHSTLLSKFSIFNPLNAAHIAAQAAYDSAVVTEGEKLAASTAADAHAASLKDDLSWWGGEAHNKAAEARRLAAVAKSELEAAKTNTLDRLGELHTAAGKLSVPKADYEAAAAAQAALTDSLRALAASRAAAAALAASAQAEYERRRAIVAAEQAKIDAAFAEASAEAQRAAAAAAALDASKGYDAAKAAAEAAAALAAANALKDVKKDGNDAGDPQLKLTPAETAALKARIAALKAAIERHEARHIKAVEAIQTAQSLDQSLALSQTQTQVLAVHLAQTQALASATALGVSLDTGVGLSQTQTNELDKLEGEYLGDNDLSEVHPHREMYRLAQSVARDYFKGHEKKQVAGTYLKDKYDFSVFQTIMNIDMHGDHVNIPIGKKDFEDFLHRELIINEYFGEDLGSVTQELRIQLHRCLKNKWDCSDFTAGPPTFKPFVSQIEAIDEFSTPEKRGSFWKKIESAYTGAQTIPTNNSIYAKYITDAIFVEGYALPLESVGGQHAQDINSRIEILVAENSAAPRRKKIGMMHGLGDGLTRTFAAGVRTVGEVVEVGGIIMQNAISVAIAGNPVTAAIVYGAGGLALLAEIALQAQLDDLDRRYKAHQPITAFKHNVGDPTRTIEFGSPEYDAQYQLQTFMIGFTMGFLSPLAATGAVAYGGLVMPVVGKGIQSAEEMYIRQAWTDHVAHDFGIERDEAARALSAVRGKWRGYIWNFRTNLWNDFTAPTNARQQDLFGRVTDTTKGIQSDLRARFAELFNGKHNHQIDENLRMYKTHIIGDNETVCSQAKRTGDKKDDFWLDCRFNLYPEHLPQLLALLSSPFSAAPDAAKTGGAYDDPFRNLIFSLWLAKINWYKYGVSETYILECMTREYGFILHILTMKAFWVLATEGRESMAALKLNYAIPCETSSTIFMDVVFPMRTSTDSVTDAAAEVASPVSRAEGGFRKARITQKHALRLRGTLKR